MTARLTPPVRGARLLALAALASFAALAPCAPLALAAAPNLAPAVAAIDTHRFLNDIAVLSSDEFEGRSPGTHGEQLAIGFIARRFRGIGLAPANPDGSYLQTVPMTGFTTHAQATIDAGAKTLTLRMPADFVAFSTVRRPHLAVDSQLVFVGYGVIAPEYHWDDYKGIDVRGKTLVMLINDPPVPDPHDPSKLDPNMFGGKAMTYYGRWTYKYEIAAKLGAAAAIIVHETGPAAYPYSVVVNSWNRENFVLTGATASKSLPTVAAWITLGRARELFSDAGLDFAALKKAAVSRDFHPVVMNARVHFAIANSWRDIRSHNVLAKLAGSDRKLEHQYVIYSAHWDHFGWDRKLPGSKHEQIFHGARDNASGVAALLELAHAFKALPRAPRRSILFIATTGEEQGLLGARYYALHPLYPLRATVADLNMDIMAMWGRTRDIELVSSGKSSLDDTVRAQASEMAMTVEPDLHPERGSVYRADQLEFARAGVPVVFFGGGLDVIGKPPGYGERMDEDYIAHRYHQVTDTIDPRWDLSGAAQEIELLLRVGDSVANTAAYPRWNANSEFRAAREQTMREAPAAAR
ncbi:MAG TPA: M28 family peptidase [Steroidobacteraceae bacterium]|nr:M28 family peptidase [Steroidobacteraceae bacterium]